MAKTDYVNVDFEMRFMEERCSKHGCQLSELDKARERLEDMRKANAAMEAERDSARALAAVREIEGAETCDVCGYALPIGGAKGPCPTHGAPTAPGYRNTVGAAPMTAANEPWTLDQVIARIESDMGKWDGLPIPDTWGIDTVLLLRLISGWRRRGEERDSARALLREAREVMGNYWFSNGGHTNNDDIVDICRKIDGRLTSDRGATPHTEGPDR